MSICKKMTWFNKHDIPLLEQIANRYKSRYDKNKAQFIVGIVLDLEL